MRSSIGIQELSAHCAHLSLPEAWLDLAHGRISAEEAAAAVADEEPAELVERSKLLFAPPSVEEDERRLELLLQAHFPVPVRRRVPQWLLGGVVALAAAGLVLVLMPRGPQPFEGGYAMTMSSGYLEERGESGASDGVTRYLAGQRIELVVRPREAEQGVDAVAFAVTEGGGTRLSVEPEIKESGVVVLAGTPEALGLPLGRSRIVVVIGPPEHLPEAYDERVQDGAEAPYDVVDAAVEIVAAPDRPAP